MQAEWGRRECCCEIARARCGVDRIQSMTIAPADDARPPTSSVTECCGKGSMIAGTVSVTGPPTLPHA